MLILTAFNQRLKSLAAFFRRLYRAFPGLDGLTDDTRFHLRPIIARPIASTHRRPAGSQRMQFITNR